MKRQRVALVAVATTGELFLVVAAALGDIRLGLAVLGAVLVYEAREATR